MLIMVQLNETQLTSYHGERARLALPDINGNLLTGKFGPGRQPVYEARQVFINAGLEVAFPRGVEPLSHYSGYTFSSEEEQYVPFHFMQERVFDLIALNAFHTVVLGKYDTDGEVDGYLGFSTSHELAYAILNKKPIISTSRVETMSRQIPQYIQDIIIDNENMFIIDDPVELGVNGLRCVIDNLPDHVEYKLDDDKVLQIERGRRELCLRELHRWLSWTKRTQRDWIVGDRPDWINERPERTLTPPIMYLALEDAAKDPDAQMYVNESKHSSFIIHAYFPNFGD